LNTAGRTRDVHQLRIELSGSRPPIWRRVLVFGDITLPQLHLTLQIVMGWENYHLHEFRIGGNAYAEPDPEDDHFGRTVLDERRVRLQKLIATAGTSFEYLYDFGDGWRHDITVESILPATPRKRYPVCIAGERSAPPEDVGGMGGYARYLEALRDIRHEDHRRLLAWRGRFDPEHFSIPSVNRALREAFPVRPLRAAQTSGIRSQQTSTAATFEEEFDQIVHSLIHHRRLPRLKGKK